ncbi:MAG: histidine phosphotransferase family protein [Rickettsiales bacterium]|nr:histidine phosphotransferase family protein [Rickettsiales bacterium]
MTNHDSRLAEMLCTRLCHDLTGPIGALSNGAEFLADEDFSMQDQAVELISQSAEQAVNRLQFYRSAYGRVNHPGEAVLSETKHLIARFFAGSKVSLDWPDNLTDALDVSVSRKMARLLQNMSMIASSTLIRGGIVSIRIQQEGARKIVAVSASGLAVKWDQEHQQVMSGSVGIDDVQPATVQLYYTMKLAQEIGSDITASATEDSFELLAVKEEVAVEASA